MVTAELDPEDEDEDEEDDDEDRTNRSTIETIVMVHVDKNLKAGGTALEGDGFS